MPLDVNPFLLCDAYKLGHIFQYPEKTEYVYSNLTPRGSRMEGINEMVFFGLQYFCLEYLQDYFNRNFFEKNRGKVMDAYKRRVKNMLGAHLPSYEHIEYIHEMQYLPLHIKALPEGTCVPMRVPVLTIINTDPAAYWLTNWVETLLSCIIWQPCTSATIAHEYRKIYDKYGIKTGMPPEFIQWQGHDFSMRGMSSLETAITSGMGHLLSFAGTDTIPAIDGLEKYYGADSDKELVGGSVAASEHAVMQAGGKESELETYRRFITQIYPEGVVSIVSDTWNLWQVVTEFVRTLKPEIMARNGKVVFRPDSGDPVKIICGDPESNTEAARKGVVECLWDVFGGTLTNEGYKLLDSHVGTIYGDSITRERGKSICEKLMQKGFASQNVFGQGSYGYQMVTRDSLGTAMKATHVVISGKSFNIFKDPITDTGLKKSAKGLLAVHKENGILTLREEVSPDEEAQGELQTVFYNGVVKRMHTLQEVRDRLALERAKSLSSTSA